MDPGKKGIEYMWIVFSIMIIGGCSGIVEREYHPEPPTIFNGINRKKRIICLPWLLL